MKEKVNMSIMEEREDLLTNKKEEISNNIHTDLMSFLSSNTDIIAIEHFLYDCGCLNVIPPLEKIPIMGLLEIDSLEQFQGGRSIKPGNIKINIKKLIDTLPEIVTVSVTVISDITILKICAAISIWKMLKDVSTIEIKREQAVVILALWKNCSEENKINLEAGYNTTNLFFSQVSENELTWEQYVNIIDGLEKMECIELDDEGIRLCEWVSKKYIN